jgi:CubicO group peptidase (beta-lactamase class C family)
MIRNQQHTAGRLAAAIVSILLLAACEAPEDQADSVSLDEFATRYAAAWSNGDPVAFASFYTENATFRINNGEPSVGREAMRIRLIEVREAGDHVEFHWHWTGTNTGPGGTGNPVDLKGHEQWTLSDEGLILESLGHMDDAEYQRQLQAAPATARNETPWPAQEWPVSTPEAQGIDARVLDQLHQEMVSGEHGYVDGMMVFRNGQLVYQRGYEHDYNGLFASKDQRPGQYNYYDPEWHPWYQGGDLHTMQSVSKSVTSALIGIAIGQGDIPGVDVPVMSYFDDYEPVDDDPRRDAITLRHLLTMTAGIDWDESSAYTDPRNSCAAMEASEDWIRYVLDQPMRAAPGDEFVYNSGLTMMLAHILFEATGMHADEYAQEHLFEPLGIDSFYWKETPTGLIDTEGGLYLSPEDLARFGYLYQNDGIWRDQRVLPEGWVASSMAPDTAVPNWPGKYGYQWWLIPYGGEAQRWAYTGRGFGGQHLLVLPEQALIIVFTGWNIYDKPSLDPVFGLQRVLAGVR